MFYELERFPFVAALEEAAEVFRDEARRVSPADFEAMSSYEQSIERRGAWTRLMFYHGLGCRQEVRRVDENCALCPRTVSVLDAIRGVRTAGISRLVAGERIQPHRDTRVPVRCHVGLVVPERCGIRGGGKTRRWEEGRCVVFDSRYVHEAWNESASDRLVLLVDIDPEVLGFDPTECLEPPTVASRVSSARQWARYAGRRTRLKARRVLRGGRRGAEH